MNKANVPIMDRIVMDPNVLVGKPVVRGTRMPVDLVLKHLAENPNVQDLFAAYPRLTVEDVQACLAYEGAVVDAGWRRHHQADAVSSHR